MQDVLRKFSTEILLKEKYLSGLLEKIMQKMEQEKEEYKYF